MLIVVGSTLNCRKIWRVQFETFGGFVGGQLYEGFDRYMCATSGINYNAAGTVKKCKQNLCNKLMSQPDQKKLYEVTSHIRRRRLDSP